MNNAPDTSRQIEPLRSHCGSPSEVAARAADILVARLPNVRSICHFGSSTRLPHAGDIDLFVSVGDSPRDAHDHKTSIAVIRDRMLGIWSQARVFEQAVAVDLEVIERELGRAIGIPVCADFGPIRPNAPAQRVHLNGPVTNSFAAQFGNAFPIHAWVIRNNAIALVGELPPAGPVTAAHVLDYIELMKPRLLHGPPQLMLKKLLQALGLLSGERSCLVEDNLLAICPRVAPFHIACQEALQSGKDALPCCYACIIRLQECAQFMERRSLDYPRDWEHGA